ncbi:F0F1 ATP synthase subunit A [Ancylobacter pratisalsi]|uniref:ATP synthase subunit a n=1 Tax=Ancylobacter pratisalsi TaxID=1745854 RepID=A0A6P1YS91_9HYPH|nr:F0F1 ATP synthase subunit A [Ancylobacter pratisalsi]QIB35740.1 F0F1 ATP synthase subunit A [Ancylobacter pratisalsi]
MNSPLTLDAQFYLGPVPITSPVLVTWAIMLVLTVVLHLATRRLALQPSRLQAMLEALVSMIDGLVIDTMQAEPARYRALIGTILIYVLVANWSSLVPGIEPPTAHLETDAALALIVFFATIYYGVHTRGLWGYLKTFAEPSWVMIPLNLIEQITRTFSLIVRLFGNIMSGVFVIGIILSLAGFLVPIPLMALDLLTGAVQAYIFTVLACVFIGAAISEGQPPRKTAPEEQTRP